jgi:hypothetical protein
MRFRGLSVNVAKPGCGAGTGAAARWPSRWCPAARARAVAEVHGHVGGYREADVRGHLLALIPSTRQSRYRGSASPHRGGAARQVPQHQWHERAEGRMGDCAPPVGSEGGPQETERETTSARASVRPYSFVIRMRRHMYVTVVLSFRTTGSLPRHHRADRHPGAARSPTSSKRPRLLVARDGRYVAATSTVNTTHSWRCSWSCSGTTTSSHPNRRASPATSSASGPTSNASPIQPCSSPSCPCPSRATKFRLHQAIGYATPGDEHHG